MQVHVYKQGKAFLEKVESYLMTNEVVNNLMLGLAILIEKKPDYYGDQPFMGVVEDDNGIAAVGLMTPPFDLIVHSELDDPTDALNELAAYLHQHQWLVPGVNGRKEISTRFAELWCDQYGLTFEVNMKTRVFELFSVDHPDPVPGLMRIATMEDIDLVTEWIAAFHTESLPGGPASTRDHRKHVEARIQEEAFYLWEDGSEVVSMAAKARPVRNGITVNAVYTPPEHRRKGYATILVAQLSQLLLDDGWRFCSLFTDLTNPTSNSIYQKIGYKPVCDFRQFLFQNSDSDGI